MIPPSKRSTGAAEAAGTSNQSFANFGTSPPVVTTEAAAQQASRNPAAPAPAQTPPPRTTHESTERSKIFDQLWTAATNGGSELGPGPAVAFFTASGLSTEVLGVIWGVADVQEPKGQLTREEFANALDLITAAQAGLSPTIENIGKVAGKIPHLGAHTEAAKAAAIAAQPAPASESSSATASAVESTPESAPIEAPAPAPEPEPAGGFTADEVAAYERLWAKATPAGEETLGPGAAVAFFGASKLDQPTLGAIWGVADRGAKGHLFKDEFFNALKLIAVVQGGGQPTEASLTSQSALPNFDEPEHTAAAPPVPARAATGPSALVALRDKLWDMVGAQVKASGDDTIDGKTLQPLLMRSKLPTAQLGSIWALADTTSAGKLTAEQFRVLLGLVSMAQNGLSADPASVTNETPAPDLGF